MKKVLIVLTCIAIIISTVFIILSLKPTSKARLTIDGVIVKEFDLNHDCTQNFKSFGADITVQVKDGAIRVSYSDCPDKICVNTGYIKSITQTAVCLPNRAVLEIIE